MTEATVVLEWTSGEAENIKNYKGVKTTAGQTF